MKLCHFLHLHAGALGWTPRQAAAVATALGHGAPDDAFAASHPGRGGGPDATPYNTALIVLAALAGGPQTQARAAAVGLFGTPQEGGPDDAATIVEPGYDSAAEFAAEVRAVLARSAQFGDILAVLLAQPALAAAVDRIEVHRGACDATLHRRGLHPVRFVAPSTAREGAARDARGELRCVATLGGDVLAELARDLADSAD